MNAPFSMIRHLTDLRWVDIHLAGDVDVATVQALIAELSEVGRLVETPLACIDLRQMTSCSLEARGTLVRLHQRLVSITDRRAYLAASPVIRGVAVWVLHVAPDRHGKVVLNNAAAVRWLTAPMDRNAQAEASLRSYVAGRVAHV